MSRRYRYTGEPDRYYPDLGLTPDPGVTYELAKNPDESRFEFVKPTAAREKTETAPPAEIKES